MKSKALLFAIEII